MAAGDLRSNCNADDDSSSSPSRTLRNSALAISLPTRQSLYES
jgi:hypothetical protein